MVPSTWGVLLLSLVVVVGLILFREYAWILIILCPQLTPTLSGAYLALLHFYIAARVFPTCKYQTDGVTKREKGKKQSLRKLWDMGGLVKKIWFPIWNPLPIPPIPIISSEFLSFHSPLPFLLLLLLLSSSP